MPTHTRLWESILLSRSRWPPFSRFRLLTPGMPCTITIAILRWFTIISDISVSHPYTRIKLEIKIGVIQKIICSIIISVLNIYHTDWRHRYLPLRGWNHTISRALYTRIRSTIVILSYFAVIAIGSLFKEIRVVCVCGRPCADNFGLTLPSISPTTRGGGGI